MRGLYIHVPFCSRKCAYCDFYSVAGKAGLVSSYIDALALEARQYVGMSFETMYLGGGTPSLLGADGLRRLITGLGRVLNIRGLREATLEVNPDSATPELLQAALVLGIDRLSIGVQSLRDEELASVGRLHSAAQAEAVLERAKKLGFTRVSADLIAGLPGQTWGTLCDSIDGVMAWGVGHLSLYCLSLEEGTPLALQPPPDLPDADMQAELYEPAAQRLKSAGLVHYEISNFALPGHECLHNLNYWRGGEYIGLGPAAASHLNGRRWRNRADLDAYLRDPAGIVEEVEELPPAAKLAEEAMLRLRLLQEGLACGGMVGNKEKEAGALAGRLERLVREGNLVYDGNRYRLPAERVLTSNLIFAAVLGD